MNAVIVPDFTAEAPLVFEARALFFLASWLEAFGEARPDGEITPHLCCIGEPTRNVRRLAERAGAGISVHPPVAGLFGGFANKLRGLEGPDPARRLLLLDADVWVLGGLEALTAIEADFAASPAGKPQVPFAVWQRIYDTLGLPLPTERIASVRGQLGLGMDTVFNPYEGQEADAAAMLPYYNSGVLFARRERELRETWEDHLRRIAILSADNADLAPFHAVIYGDQVTLATSLQALQGGGCSFQRLPDGFNTRLVHLRAGALPWEDVRLFHATGFLKGLCERRDLPTLLDQYAERWAGAIREGNIVVPDAGQPRRWLRRLWERWVEPAWENAR